MHHCLISHAQLDSNCPTHCEFRKTVAYSNKRFTFKKLGCRVGGEVKQQNSVSSKLIRSNFHRKKITNLKFRRPFVTVRSDERLTLVLLQLQFWQYYVLFFLSFFFFLFFPLSNFFVTKSTNSTPSAQN